MSWTLLQRSLQSFALMASLLAQGSTGPETDTKDGCILRLLAERIQVQLETSPVLDLEILDTAEKLIARLEGSHGTHWIASDEWRTFLKNAKLNCLKTLKVEPFAQLGVFGEAFSSPLALRFEPLETFGDRLWQVAQSNFGKDVAQALLDKHPEMKTQWTLDTAHFELKHEALKLALALLYRTDSLNVDETHLRRIIALSAHLMDAGLTRSQSTDPAIHDDERDRRNFQGRYADDFVDVSHGDKPHERAQGSSY